MSETNGKGPGLIQMATSVVRAPFERRALEAAMDRRDRLAADHESAWFEENTVRRVLPDPDEITDFLIANVGDRELPPETSRRLQERALEASLTNPHSVGYLRTLSRFVIGEGPTFTPEGVSEDVAAVMEEVWDDFKMANDWDSMEDELPYRAWRDGETFLRAFEHRRDGPVPNWRPSTKALRHLAKHRINVSQSALMPPSIPGGTLLLRFIPVDQIGDPDGVIPHGILTSADDVVTVLGYLWCAPDSSGVMKPKELIPASEVRHFKIRVDQDVKRGRSILEPVLKKAEQYEEWVGYRLALNLVRSGHALFKKVMGSRSQVTSVRDAQTTTRTTRLNDRKAKAIKAGTTVTHNNGIEYEFKGPNLQAQDAQHDGRMLTLAMATPTGIPEYMWTGDASNANFASTMVAESPAVREFEDWQDTLRPEYRWIYRRAMATSARWGKLRNMISPEAAESLEVTVAYPTMIFRDELKRTQRNAILNANSVLSKEGWAADEGIDYEIEQERIRTEREEDVEFGLVVPPFGSEDRGDDEDDG